MRTMQIVLAQMVMVVILSSVSPVYALGSQSFPVINYNDDVLTDAEIEAAETTFSDAGILPDNPFYFLKRFAEGIRLFFTFDGESKAKLHLDFAKTRLAEAKKLADGKKTESVNNSLAEFNKELNEFETASKGIGKNVSSLVKEGEEVLLKSRIVLGLVAEKVPESARPAIAQAINNSIVKRVNIAIKDDDTTSKEKIEKEIEKSVVISQQIKEKAREREERSEEAETPEKRKKPESVKEIKEIPLKEKPRKICIQVITPAQNPITGECKNFPTPCDVPEGWEKTDSCSSILPDTGIGKIL